MNEKQRNGSQSAKFFTPSRWKRLWDWLCHLSIQIGGSTPATKPPPVDVRCIAIPVKSRKIQIAVPIRIRPRVDPPEAIKDPEPKPASRPETINDILICDARIRRNLGTEILVGPGLDDRKFADRWQIDIADDDPVMNQIHIVRNLNTRAYGIVLQTVDDWLFWTGPKKKLFVPAGQHEIWTTPDRKTALIVAGFIYSHGLKTKSDQ